LVAGDTLSRAGYTYPAERRKIGMVFQDAALLPHLDALRNVAFGLHGIDAAERETRAREMLVVVGLADAATRFPHEMSGGQQQRVALARALAPRPQLLLLDEPFANLDAGLRDRLGADIRTIIKQQGVTALMVTHDQLEAFTLGDYVGVMRDGTIAQWGTPHEVYHQPVDRYVADFVGRGVLLPARVLDYERLEVAGMELKLAIPPEIDPGSDAELLLRPDDVVPMSGGIPAEIVQRSFLGPTIVYALRLPGGEQVLSSIPAHQTYAEGSTIEVDIRPVHVVLFTK
ncbi:MAG: ABC transporter ATP-binding protein, partial [Gammaproteobacteria bacterium]|nr:ABC transporter ATP-binding protein [Gammaproteobacteria bacterium]